MCGSPQAIIALYKNGPPVMCRQFLFGAFYLAFQNDLALPAHNLHLSIKTMIEAKPTFLKFPKYSVKHVVSDLPTFCKKQEKSLNRTCCKSAFSSAYRTVKTERNHHDEEDYGKEN